MGIDVPEVFPELKYDLKRNSELRKIAEGIAERILVNKDPDTGICGDIFSEFLDKTNFGDYTFKKDLKDEYQYWLNSYGWDVEGKIVFWEILNEILQDYDAEKARIGGKTTFWIPGDRLIKCQTPTS